MSAAGEDEKMSDVVPATAADHLEDAALTGAEERTQRRAAQTQSLNASRSVMNRQKTVDSLKRFSYLLGQTELFQHFIDIKKDRDPEFARLLEESAQ